MTDAVKAGDTGASAAEALAGLWGALDGDSGDLDRVELTSPDEFLPSVYPVTAVAAATVGVTGLAASLLHERRAGEARSIRLDGRHAAASFRSDRWVRVDGQAPESPWDELSGYYRASAGEWVQLHCNFPHHRAGVVAVLDTADDRVAVEAAIAEWDAQELEDRLAAAGMCASRFRSTEQWAEHPHGQVVRAEPLVQVQVDASTGSDGSSRTGLGWTDGANPLPLAGCRVLDLSRVIAGPVTGRTLAALGAEVLRVGADGLAVIDTVLPDTNLGKRFTHLDLRVAEAVDGLWRLIEQADVLIDGFRPGALASLGFDIDTLWTRRPGLVVVDLSAYGHVGPWAGRRGFDSLVQTASGIGWSGRKGAGTVGPFPLPAQAIDHGTGWIGAAAAILALDQRLVDGYGRRIDVALARTGAWIDSLGRIDGLDLPDPGRADIADLLATVTGTDEPVEHVSFPLQLDGMTAGWTCTASAPGADTPTWTR